MEISCNTAGLSTNWETGKLTISFETDCVAQIKAEYDRLKDLPKLRLKVVKWTDKRSLDANAYYWVLCGKIAEAMDSSIEEIHNNMLISYGHVFVTTEDGEYIPECHPENFAYLKEKHIHLFPTDKTWKENGKVFRWFFRLKGSSEFNTAEMSRLIDGTVSEAKELGIETMTPTELERMKAAWQKA